MMEPVIKKEFGSRDQARKFGELVTEKLLGKSVKLVQVKHEKYSQVIVTGYDTTDRDQLGDKVEDLYLDFEFESK